MDPRNITRATTWVGLQLQLLESTGSAKNSQKLNYQMKLELFRNKIETKPKPKDTPSEYTTPISILQSK